MLQLYNTLTKKKEEFKPIEKGKVGLYTCGPTVYGLQHIGNYKSFTTADLLRRYLAYLGYEVRHIQNITDVGHLTDDDVAQGDSGEDKMLKTAKKEKKSPEEIAQYYTSYHIEKSRELNMLDPHLWPRATRHIPHMIALIEKLIAQGHAYESGGNVFLCVTSFEKYGALSGNTLENLNVGARFEQPHPDKRNQWDFALWLSAPKEHLMQWDSPWGRGYPGWHIECSAMSIEYLGDTFDIHTGGEDHIFPHHEAEIAQSEGATGKKFVHYWLHTRHMLIEDKKMSKSKGNLYTIEDIKKKGYTPMHLRMGYILSHYRSQMNFTWSSLEQAKKNYETLEKFHHRLDTSVAFGEKPFDVNKYRTEFEAAMNDDLNTPLATTILLGLIKDSNARLDKHPIHNLTDLRNLFAQLTNVFGLVFTKRTTDDTPSNIQNLAKQREEARKKKDFARADALRDQITVAGYTLKDTSDGVKIVKM